MPDDMINHPAHYGGDTTYEVIKVIDAWGLSFSLSTAIKYIARAHKKGNPRQDLLKAIWYIEHELTRLEKQQ